MYYPLNYFFRFQFSSLWQSVFWICFFVGFVFFFHKRYLNFLFLHAPLLCGGFILPIVAKSGFKSYHKCLGWYSFTSVYSFFNLKGQNKKPGVWKLILSNDGIQGYFLDLLALPSFVYQYYASSQVDVFVRSIIQKDHEVFYLNLQMTLFFF